MLTKSECVQWLFAQLNEIQSKLSSIIHKAGYWSEMMKVEKQLKIVAVIMYCFGYCSEYDLWEKSSQIINDEERADSLITVCESFRTSLNKGVKI